MQELATVLPLKLDHWNAASTLPAPPHSAQQRQCASMRVLPKYVCAWHTRTSAHIMPEVDHATAAHAAMSCSEVQLSQWLWAGDVAWCLPCRQRSRVCGGSCARLRDVSREPAQSEPWLCLSPWDPFDDGAELTFLCAAGAVSWGGGPASGACQTLARA